MKMSILAAAGLAAASLTIASGASAATTEGGAQRSCFNVSNWQGWSSPSSDTLYLRINNREVYKVGLVGKPDGRSLKSPGTFLVSKVRGSSFVCSPIDLDLAVADDHGFKRPLFPKTLTRLTAEQVAAIPKKDRP